MIAQHNKINDIESVCYHCGESCPDDSHKIDDKIFCCNGCRTVYQLLDSSGLCNYYSIDEYPGISKKSEHKRNYDFLDDPSVHQKLLDFTDGTLSKITFYIPQMHCSSCIWILENLYKLHPGILNSHVNFLKKEVVIKYAENDISLKEIVTILDSIGYEPLLNLADGAETKERKESRSLYYKIGIAGFSFGNVMLLSFPEYLSITDTVTDTLRNLFGFINLTLSLPVVFYSGIDYFISAWKGLRKRIVNIDVPIALGIITLFLRSVFEITAGTGGGYFDSLTGLIFFLLIGRLFQNKTYETLNFERDYKSYFPIAVSVRKDSGLTTVPVENLKPGERLFIRNNELIPADSVLINGAANIDYSFVTGESEPVARESGEIIYAGGRQFGSAIEVETVKEVSQSYLTQLWNNDSFKKKESSRITLLANRVSKYFTFTIISIALGAFVYWSFADPSLAFNAFTAVLIVACPCALALSTPFTLGNTLRIFGRNKFYLKNTSVIEKLAGITSIVFDKTGTLTESGRSSVKFVGNNLGDFEKSLISGLVRNSSHPLSIKIAGLYADNRLSKVSEYEEHAGMGISAKVDDINVKLGAAAFVDHSAEIINSTDSRTKVYLKIDEKILGYFEFSNYYREGLGGLISTLSDQFKFLLISGDNEGEKDNLMKIFPASTRIKFRQSPHDKLETVHGLQSGGERVLMIGDGLNDAGALMQSDVGISVSEDINNFSPACDAVLESNNFRNLDKYIYFARTSKKIILASFAISFIYNLFGIAIAVQGILSPIVAAILMPLSSISVVIFTTFSTMFFAKKKGLLKWK